MDQGKVKFDRVLIETTGLADPAPVVQTFFMDELLSKKFEVDSILTVVDSKHVTKHLDHHDHSTCNHDQPHNHDYVHHTGIKTITIQDIPSVSRKQLKKWLKSLPEGIIRGKGYVSLKDEPGVYPFQYSSNQVHISNFPQKRPVDPCIVLIGKDIDIMNIQNSYTSQFSL